MIVLLPELGLALVWRVGLPVMALAVTLHVLVAAAATALGAWTSRAVLASPATSILTLLGTCTAVLVLGMGPLRALTVPMIEWMRAAGAGPGAFTAAFPGFAARIVAWSVLVASGYVYVRRSRP